MHWADVLAEQTHGRAERHVLATAITPSGPIHVGNMREVLTTEMVARSLRQNHGADAELIYIADSYDPLRKVYPYLDAAVYEELVGRPLAEIPCPCGDHDSYAAHYLEPFLGALEELGVEITILDAHRMYREGRYAQVVATALEASAGIREILGSASKRRLSSMWVPFNVQCPECHRLTTTTAQRLEGTKLQFSCSCGAEGTIDAASPGAGKLPWRVDWPARWRFLGVTFEAMGKDHAASGGSWDTGVRIVRDVFGVEPPSRTVYEFIQLKGVGAMHSSTGTAVSAEAVLRMTPPEVLRFLIARNQPHKHLDFDPGLGLIDLVEEYDEYERVALGGQEARTGMKDVERTYALSQPAEVSSSMPVQVGYRHLATVVQIAVDDADVAGVLARAGTALDELPQGDRRRVLQRIEHVRYWLANFAPARIRFTVQQQRPDLTFEPAEADVLRSLVARLATVDWNAQALHDAVHAAAAEANAKPAVAFRSVYKALLGQNSGPRAGFFLASLDPRLVRGRLAEVVA